MLTKACVHKSTICNIFNASNYLQSYSLAHCSSKDRRELLPEREANAVTSRRSGAKS